MSQEKVLSVNNLAINFKTDNGILKAVRDISFDLNRGETLCIVGESGSGKSVTSKAIMGILANNAIIESGNIMYRGENLLEVSEDQFYKIRGHKIGMIFQDPLSSLNPIVRIGKQITEAMMLNSDKLKLMYEDLISDDLIRYKNTVAKMKIEISNEKKKLEEFITVTENQEGLTGAQRKENKKLIAEKKKAFKVFEEETKKKYQTKAKELKAVLDETEKKAKKQVEEYKAKVTVEHKANLDALNKKLAAASSADAKEAVKKEIEQENLEFTNKLKLTKAEAKRRALEIMKEVGIPEPERRFKQYPF